MVHCALLLTPHFSGNSISCEDTQSEGLNFMKKRDKRAIIEVRPIFDSIRKPVAPPGHPLSEAKPDVKARPSLRKAKHKRRDDEVDE